MIVAAPLRASVIVPTWCRRRSLRRLLFSIRRQSIADQLEIIVADSASPDGTAELLQRFSRRIMPVRMIQSENSPAAKRNAGARVARSRILLFFDDDMYLDDHRVLETFLTELEASSGPLCFRVSYPYEWCRKSTYYQFKQLGHDRTNAGCGPMEPWRFVSMAFGIRAEQFGQVGAFDESYKTYGCEDHAFEFALRANGMIPFLSEKASALHMEDSRTFLAYREKLVTTAARTMPVLIGSWPLAREHGGVGLMESRPVRVLVRMMPHGVVVLLSKTVARILDNWPAAGSRRLFSPLTRLFMMAAYVEGMSLRGRRA